MTPQERAEKSAQSMMAKDTASRELGMELIAVSAGAATLRMVVTPKMLNGHGICHGGYIFTLADSAFAFACNSYNRLTVAQQNQITYIAPAQAHETLTAQASETASAGRSGVYDVMVTGTDARIIATMRGLSRNIKGQLFDEEDDTA